MNFFLSQQVYLVLSLLFILYVNDLPNITLLFHPTLFADDTIISMRNSSSTDLTDKCQLRQINNTGLIKLLYLYARSICNKVTDLQVLIILHEPDFMNHIRDMVT